MEAIDYLRSALAEVDRRIDFKYFIAGDALDPDDMADILQERHKIIQAIQDVQIANWRY